MKSSHCAGMFSESKLRHFKLQAESMSGLKPLEEVQEVQCQRRCTVSAGHYSAPTDQDESLWNFDDSHLPQKTSENLAEWGNN